MAITQEKLNDIRESPGALRNANYKAGGTRIVVEVSGRGDLEIDQVMIEIRTLADHFNWLWDRRSSWAGVRRGGLEFQRFVFLAPKGTHDG